MAFRMTGKADRRRMGDVKAETRGWAAEGVRGGSRKLGVRPEWFQLFAVSAFRQRDYYGSTRNSRPPPRNGGDRRAQDLIVDFLEIQGNPDAGSTAEVPALTRGSSLGKGRTQPRGRGGAARMARAILERFASRAYRRAGGPPGGGFVGGSSSSSTWTTEREDSFEQREIQLCPSRRERDWSRQNFLFRVEARPSAAEERKGGGDPEPPGQRSS